MKQGSSWRPDDWPKIKEQLLASFLQGCRTYAGREEVGEDFAEAMLEALKKEAIFKPGDLLPLDLRKRWGGMSLKGWLIVIPDEVADKE